MKKVTTRAVYDAIRAAHPELVPFGSYTAPTGEAHNPLSGVVMTSYGFPDCDNPIVMIEDRWDIDEIDRTKRSNQTTTCWLILEEE